MKTVLIFIVFICTIMICYAQEQPYKNGFIFSSAFVNNGRDSLLLLKEKTTSVLREVGFLERSRERILLRTDSAYYDNVHKKISYKNLRGVIKERNEDSLFIKFFPIKKKPTGNNPAFVNSDDNDSLFVLIIKWDTSAHGKEKKDIPYRHNQITAVNFPIRVNFSDGTLETGFTNIAVSVTRVRGKARVYKSCDLYETRYRNWGYGLMMGVGSRKDINDKEELSINGGLSLIGSMFGIKLIVACGYESGFKSTSKKGGLFMGFGFGVDIYEIFNPEIKQKG